MSAPTFEAGATVYLLSGRECEYVSAAGNQHVVAPLYDTEYGPETRDHKLVDRVYREAPSEKLASEVLALETRLADLKAQIRDGETVVREFERDAVARKARLTAHAGLQRLDDFIAGRITHFAMVGYDPPYRIDTFDQALKPSESECRTRSLRLLSLFGGTNGDLTWNINRWSDGSGSWNECIPCTSYQEAEVMILARIEKDLHEKWAKESSRPWVMDKIIVCAKSFGVPVPEEIETAVTAYKVQAAQDRVAKMRAELDSAEAYLAAAMEPAP